MAVNPNFLVRDVNWRYETTRLPGGDPQQVPVGVTQAKVTCRECGHDWVGVHGDGTLSDGLGGLRIVCPKCGRDEFVAMIYV